MIKRHVYKRFDAHNPRAVIEITPLQSDFLSEAA